MTIRRSQKRTSEQIKTTQRNPKLTKLRRQVWYKRRVDPKTRGVSVVSDAWDWEIKTLSELSIWFRVDLR